MAGLTVTPEGRPLTGPIAVADEWLRQWSAEVASYQHRLNGWLPESILGRLARQGAAAASQPGPGAPTMEDKLVAVDKAVAVISDPKVTKVVSLWYLSSDRYNQRICAERSGFSDRHFQRLLKSGRECVAQLLGLF